MEVLGVGSIPVAILPSCQYMNNIALFFLKMFLFLNMFRISPGLPNVTDICYIIMQRNYLVG